MVVYAVPGGLYCSCVGESLWTCGGVVKTDVVKWAYVKEKVLVCTP